ncbi:hypothetical protein PIIN_05243 [Serendipita indica DSM 11827]|uniref:Uncharacterized protein n=1 Tax=Serendipita indica (strain DSM 11827) TaxID=1109443 RepID=G4TJ11_SERID|nr:hypothetical protein PIIN_05243 [Serendipita indica DSM 11827]
MSEYLETGTSPTILKYYNSQAIGLLGLVTWELIVTTPFEWRFIKEKKAPHWSLPFYTGSRLSLLLYLVTIVTNGFGHQVMPCNVQAWIMHVTTSLAIWLPGALLCLRILKLWIRIERILGFLGVLLSGLMLINCLTWQTPDMTWDSSLTRCIIRTGTHKAITLAQYLYTFAFYLTLSIIFAKKHLPRRTLADVYKLVVEDGLGIYILVTIVFLGQAIITCIWVNDLVIILFVPIALTVTLIAVTRSYVHEAQLEQAKLAQSRRLPGHRVSVFNNPTSRPVSRPPSSWRKSKLPPAATPSESSIA